MTVSGTREVSYTFPSSESSMCLYGRLHTYIQYDLLGLIIVMVKLESSVTIYYSSLLAYLLNLRIQPGGPPSPPLMHDGSGNLGKRHRRTYWAEQDKSGMYTGCPREW